MEIIKEHLFIEEEILKIGLKISERDDNDALQKCALGLMDRLYLTLFNAKLLMLTKPYQPEITYSISLLLRTTMVDSFLAVELCQIARECSISMEFSLLSKKCLEFLGDGINQSKIYLEKLKKSHLT